MPIDSVGGSGSGDPSQILAKTLSRLNGTQAANSISSGPKNPATKPAATPNGDAGNALTGTQQSNLSNRNLSMLIQLQNQTPAKHSPIAPYPNRTATTKPTDSPVSQNGAGSADTSASAAGSRKAPRAFRSHQEEIDAAMNKYA